MSRDFRRESNRDEPLVSEIKNLAEEIIVGLDNGDEVQDLLRKLCELTGQNYDESELRMVPGGIGTQHFAELAALGLPPSVSDLTRDEIIDLIQAASKPNTHAEYYLELLEGALPNAEISDLIFHGDRARTPGEIADEALHRVQLFKDGGLGAVRAHLVRLADAVRGDPSAPIWAQQWARGYRQI